MKTDKIFYTLFQIFPELLFQLIGESPEMAQNYEFRSIEIKELAFRLDGVFLPNEEANDVPIYFVEVQFQRDEDFYWRFITEIFLYLKQYKPRCPCYGVVLWGNGGLDVGLPEPYRGLLVEGAIGIIYLDRMAPDTPESLGVGIIKFINAPPVEATERVPLLIEQARSEINDPVSRERAIELIEKIVVYKFPEKTPEEIEAMLDLVQWEQTKFYQEAEQKGKLKTVPLLLRLGLSTQQIAQELQIDLDLINQYIATQNETRRE